MQYDIIVIGAGASGMLAAGSAAEAGASVLLLEKMRQNGRKIGITGKGRCNITNSAELEEFINHFGKNGKFLRSAFSSFFSEDIIRLLEKQNVAITLERGGRYFPTSGKALDIVRALNRWLKQNNVRVQQQSPVENLQKTAGGFAVQTRTGEITTSRIIIATGGVSYPRTGSSGDGYQLAGSLGHRIVPIQPALVPLTSPENFIAKLSGLDLKNVASHLHINGKRRASEFGELSFNKTGLTGPTTLSLSGEAVKALKQNNKIEIIIDLKPALDHKKLDARLIRDLTRKHEQTIEVILRGLLPRQLIPVCLQLCQLAPQTAAGTFPAQLRKKLVHWLKNFAITIDGHRPLDEAIITAGGVSLKEINPTTMESRKVPGLYIVGELLDLQADTGGYNLQAAFSTGWLAGKSAARKTGANNER